MPTINLQDNPNRTLVGSPGSDAVIITSDFSDSGLGIVYYEIQNRDVDEYVAFKFNTGLDISTYANILTLSVTTLKIVLRNRTNYKVRNRQGGGGWSAWVKFKTRDKRYQSPDAITQLTDNAGRRASKRGNITITVTNSAKATVTRTATGARVVNSDNTGYVNTTSITNTATGARVVNVD